MLYNKVLLIGPLPPPRTGQALGFQLLVDEFIKENLPFDYLNTASRSVENRRDQAFSFIRSLEMLVCIFSGLLRIVSPQIRTVYLTISQSPLGFVKDFAFINFAKLMRKNIIVHLKGGNYANFYHSRGPIFKRLIKYTVSNADVILVLGELLKDNFSFVKYQEKIKVLHNTAPEFCDDRTRDCKKLNSQVKLLYLSNITPSKGIFDLIDACELLVADGIDFELHIAGDFILNSDCNNIRDNKHLRQLFLSKIKKFHNCIFYHGIADKNLKYRLLENCHVFVLPTYYNNEGQPIAIIESLCFGLAVISTEYRDIPEMLHSGENGYFVKPCCPKDIADKIGKMVCDYALFEKFSKYSIDLYHNQFTRHRHLGGIKKVLWRTSC